MSDNRRVSKEEKVENNTHAASVEVLTKNRHVQLFLFSSATAALVSCCRLVHGALYWTFTA